MALSKITGSGTDTWAELLLSYLHMHCPVLLSFLYQTKRQNTGHLATLHVTTMAIGDNGGRVVAQE